MFNPDKIRELLEDRGITQAQLLRDLKLSKSNLYVWMNGSTIPGVDNLELIADYFKVSTDIFFNRGVDLSGTTIGHNVRGNGNKVSGDITLSECQKELEHLKDILKEKEERIKDKDEMIAFFKQQLNK